MGHHDPVNDSDLPGAPAPATPDPDSPGDPGAPVSDPVPPVPAAPPGAPVDAWPPEAAPVDARAHEAAPEGPPPAAPVDALAPEAAPEGPPPAAPERPPAPDPVRTQNRIALLGTLAVVVVLAIGGAVAIGRATAPGGAPSDTGVGLVPATASPASSGAPAGSSAPSGSAAVEPTAPASPGTGLPSEGNRLGSADAKVVVEYWADFQCPFCAKFAKGTIPELAPLIADGTIALVHRDYTFIGPESIDAAVAVRCAGRQGRYWPMHDAVYAAQAGENQGAFARPKLVAIGTAVGLDATTLEACMDDRGALVDVLADTGEAVRIGIQSTPTVIVNGTRFLGVPDTAKLRAAIDDAAAGASPAPAPSVAPAPNPWSDTPTKGLTAGDPAAPVTVDLWMDYQSADSNAVAATLDPELRKRIAAGTIQVRLHDLALLGDESVVAATALHCTAAQDGPAWFMHEILARAARGKDAGLFTADNLLRLSAQLGLDVRAFDACLADPSVAQAVKDETAKGQADGMTAGPVVVVSAGGAEKARFAGPPDVAKVLAAIDAAAKP